MTIGPQHPNIWFTSDSHFGHANVIRYDNDALESRLGYQPRPYKNADEMDLDIIARWNAVVGPHDLVFHLGDFSLDKSVERARSCASRLNGRKHLILGNHRSTDERLKEHFEWLKEYYEMNVHDSDATASNGQQLLCLFHYPITQWNKAHRGSWHLYGHCHGGNPDSGFKSFDIGIMLHGMRPLSYAEIKDKMASRMVKGHHEKGVAQ